MARGKPPVLAVIPAHNASGTLPALLDELIKQKYDGIFVIDDASTDSTAKVAKSYGPKVSLIKGGINAGAGANRNRIIGQTKNSILHFIDADMELLSKNTPDIIRKLKWPKNTAYIGGMVHNPNGEQNPFNFGPRPSITTYIQSVLQFVIWLIGARLRLLGSTLRNAMQPFLHAWPNIYKSPRARRTFWTAESNMVIKSSMFERLGGYDPNFRYAEINDFAIRLHRLGLKTYFDPRIDVLHNTTDNIFHRRSQKMAAHKQLVKKHGRRNLVAPNLVDYLTGRKTQKRYHR